LAAETQEALSGSSSENKHSFLQILRF